MKKLIFKFLGIYAIFAGYGCLQTLLFICFHSNQFEGLSFVEMLSPVCHGFSMDCSVAAYLSVIPGVVIAFQAISNKKWLQTLLSGYLLAVSILLAIITVVDLSLYSYWGFRLDSTPLFYFSTSPAAALASATLPQLLLGGILILVFSSATFFLFKSTVLKTVGSGERQWKTFAVLIFLTVLLFIPLRGGVTVSTMNPSRAYFSDRKILNHAALNPGFNLLYSLTHSSLQTDGFKYFTPGEMSRWLDALNDGASCQCDSVCDVEKSGFPELLNCTRPDIYLIILESFSAHLMPSLGGDSIAMHLDSLANTGILFTDFFANSFRTDRALPSVLAGFPALPSMSILKYVEKAENLPGLANTLGRNGYETTYYYGGDINFANIKAYLVSSGFGKIVSDSDFPLSDRTGKWGAHDHILFKKVAFDSKSIEKSGSLHPRFCVVQTSSSHEPFEVPYRSERYSSHPPKNAFEYTDRCLGDFVNEIKESSRWDCSLFIVVPDHLGAWPLNLSDAPSRHHVPLAIFGGALNVSGVRLSVPGSQTDIAATLLSMLDIDSSGFPFSRDLFDSSLPHYGVFTEPEIIGLVQDNDTVIFNIETGKLEKGNASECDADKAKAYLQHLYQTVSEL